MSAAAISLAVLLFVTGPPAAAPDAGASITIFVGDGGTQVHNRGTTWVSVTPTEGKTQVVAPGTKAEFTGTGDSPGTGQARGLQPPALLSPADKAQVRVKPSSEKGLGPIVLTWAPVAGAKEYEVELQVGDGKPVVLKAQRTEARLPLLPAGKVAWTVRSVGDGGSSEASSRRWFEVQPEQMKLEVKGSGWK
jgi:hypothetical protein